MRGIDGEIDLQIRLGEVAAIRAFCKERGFDWKRVLDQVNHAAKLPPSAHLTRWQVWEEMKPCLVLQGK